MINNLLIPLSCVPAGWRASADNARLYFEDDEDNKRIGAWCANDRDNQWLQVDLGKTKKIRAIATQGESYNSNRKGQVVLGPDNNKAVVPN